MTPHKQNNTLISILLLK